MSPAAQSEQRAYAGFMDHLAKMNWEWNISEVDSDGSGERMANNIEDAVARGVDAIIVSMADLRASAVALKSANDARIPVFSIDSQYTPGVVVDITSNHYVMSSKVSSYLVDRLGGAGNVVALTMAQAFEVMGEKCAQLIWSIVVEGKPVADVVQVTTLYVDAPLLTDMDLNEYNRRYRLPNGSAATAAISIFLTNQRREWMSGRVWRCITSSRNSWNEAVGVTVAMAFGEFDLSTGSVVGLACVLVMGLITKQRLPPVIAIVIVLPMGIGVGGYLHVQRWEKPLRYESRALRVHRPGEHRGSPDPCDHHAALYRHHLLRVEQDPGRSLSLRHRGEREYGAPLRYRHGEVQIHRADDQRRFRRVRGCFARGKVGERAAHGGRSVHDGSVASSPVPERV